MGKPQSGKSHDSARSRRFFGPSPTKICGQSRRKERVAANQNGLEDAIGTHSVIIIFGLWHENEKKRVEDEMTIKHMCNF